MGAFQAATARRPAGGRLVGALAFLACAWGLTAPAAHAQGGAPLAAPAPQPPDAWRAAEGGPPPDPEAPHLPLTPAPVRPGLDATGPPFSLAPAEAPASPRPLNSPGGGAGPRPQPSNVEEQFLLPLLVEERKLLRDYGPDHPDVQSVRERIRAIHEYLQRHPPPAPPRPEPQAAAPPTGPVTPAGGGAKARDMKLELLPSTQMKFEFLPITVVSGPAPVAPGAAAKVENGVTPERGPAPRGDDARPPAARLENGVPPERGPAPAPPTSPGGRGQVPSPGEAEGGPPPKPGEATCPAARTESVPAPLPATTPPACAAPPGKQGVEMAAGETARDGGPGNAVADFFLRTPAGQLAGLVGALLAGLLVHLVSLSVIIRWHGRWMARQIRAEVARLPAPGFAAWSAAPAGQWPPGSGPLLLTGVGAAAAETPGPGPARTEDAHFPPGEDAGGRQPRRLLFARREWVEGRLDEADPA